MQSIHNARTCQMSDEWIIFAALQANAPFTTEERRKYGFTQVMGKALMFSDSEDEVVEDEEEKREFKSSEDCFIR